MDAQIFTSIRILVLTGFAFLFTIAWTPLWTYILFHYRLGKQIRSEGAPIFARLHEKKAGTPTAGGVLVWGTTVVFALLFWALEVVDGPLFGAFNFLSRRETLLPLGAMAISALIGLADDLLGIFRIGPKGGGLGMGHRLLLYTIVAVGGAWWFSDRLEWQTIHIPFLKLDPNAVIPFGPFAFGADENGFLNIGILFFFLAIVIIVATSFSTNETDGLDGLAGGVLLIAFASYAVIAFVQGKPALATLCAVIVGSLLAFLWFNVYPARFFMGDTGTMSLGVTLGIIAMLTATEWLLPFLGFILVIESLSVIVQLVSKRFFKRKIFLSTPIHHHFEAIGWPETKVTMRFWIIAGVMASLGLALFFIERAVTFS
ncbi:MAG: hypothetical protein HY460_02615 [Parcubacteria group bacterium]|nr:hypothetical protein [Parcubacteria group bacterium]